LAGSNAGRARASAAAIAIIQKHRREVRMPEFLEPDKVQMALHDKICEVVRLDNPTVMVQKWVCIIEVLNDEGSPELWSMGSPNLSAWDRIGLVEFHSRMVQPHGEEDED
jgi:hypothetical protein